MPDFLDCPVNAVREGNRGQAIRLIHDNAPLAAFMVIMIERGNVNIRIYFEKALQNGHVEVLDRSVFSAAILLVG
ncbi:hypothetical protein Q4488_17085 [Amphritea sp. 1_MG-2023]|uniref:hypothetical protein n=1 Tax=Amphritea sp. 1_MG-2023 TaxID=3062670 RepID=UPI0026E2BF25|nr:hypothetical protein [Amphritea sp. 1_MG-2023]MDO6565094.1 hypothetical protein [Amphritea sp. 1_MG-2023]